jgi:hypothetical protein
LSRELYLISELVFKSPKPVQKSMQDYPKNPNDEKGLKDSNLKIAPIIN